MMNGDNFLTRAALPASLAFIGASACFALQATGLAVVAALCLALVVSITAWRRLALVVPAAFALLAIMPFFVGVSRTPRIFLDEVLLLVLLVTITAQTLLGRPPLRLRRTDLALALLCLLLMALTMLSTVPNNAQLRAFIESLGLGTLLCVAMAQYSTENRILGVSKMLVWIVCVLSVLGIVEFLARYNPLMEYVENVVAVEFDFDFLYFSQEIMELNDAIYRPYVVFFHPSEAGTFVAMCMPFAFALAGEKRCRALCLAALVLGGVFLLLNMTRGVWAACLLTAFIFIRKFRRFSLLLLPLGIAALVVLLAFYSETSLAQRLLNPTNLLIRFLFWETGLSYFLDDWLLGVGFYNFSEVYTASPVQAPVEAFEIAAGISTVDNMFLMVLVEQGVLGFAGFALLLLLLGRRMLESRSRMREAGAMLSERLVTACLAGFSIFIVCGLMADVHVFVKASKLVFMIAGVAWGVGLGSGDGKQPEKDALRGFL